VTYCVDSCVVGDEADALPANEMERVGKQHVDASPNGRRYLALGPYGGVSIRNDAAGEGKTQEQGGNPGL
jgi:hypothetical protein